MFAAKFPKKIFMNCTCDDVQYDGDQGEQGDDDDDQSEDDQNEDDQN